MAGRSEVLHQRKARIGQWTAWLKRRLVFTLEGSGPWPAAIFYMDGLGIRPTLFEMASGSRIMATLCSCPERKS
jgi:hypothetical protein